MTGFRLRTLQRAAALAALLAFVVLPHGHLRGHDAVASERAGGFGGGGGVLGFARRIAGVDVLRVEAPTAANAAGGPRIAVGKYITDRIYVGAVSSADTSSSALQVEVEVAPNINVNVETGADANHAVGVTWKQDY